ncbi:thioesterase family protein [Luminiphilus sp.]|nr:thioesterase family protein [Luminiphilus sp.]MDB2511763.1 thioesterase family protein [Luminiphilus sp.]MDB2691537.1 thioesterase family protein [Luminiphilus sp.]
MNSNEIPRLTFAEVLDVVTPERVGDYWFIGDSLKPQFRLFGGQVVAQCLLAAYETVEDHFTAHSMHCYFLRAGDASVPIELEVDPIRNGRSFCTRRVVARQRGEAIFNTSISYHVEEEGMSHSLSMPDVISPEEAMRLNAERDGLLPHSLLDLFGVERERITERLPEAQEPVSQSWYRVIGPFEGCLRTQQAALAMISDFSLYSTAFSAFPYERPEKVFVGASLDHAIWFHDIPKMDEWVLYDTYSPWSGGARGYNRGSLWSRDGKLIASTAQEGLMRIRRDR